MACHIKEYEEQLHRLCPILLTLAAPIYVCFVYLQVLFPLYMFYFFFSPCVCYSENELYFRFTPEKSSQGRSEIPNEKVINT